MKNDWQKAEQVLKKGGAIIAPTDTLYGILARAEDKKAVEKVYKIKGRNEGKPFIILITDIKDLNKFKIKHSNILQNIRMFVGKKVSMILPCESGKFKYLHRGKKSLAFRIIGPRNRNLFNLIKKVGPLVAPSANPQGLNPAQNVWEAKKYFGNKIDMYMCGCTRTGQPSTVVEIKNGKMKIIRQGSAQIKIPK